MNCLNTLPKYPGSAQWPFERGTRSQPQTVDWRTAQDMLLHPGVYRDQIQIAAQPPVHNNPAPKGTVWSFLGAYIYFPPP